MTTRPPSGLRVAVADDERDMRQFFQELLPHLGHTVVAAAETGRQLVEQCRAAAPDIIITDIKMPDMDGIEAAAALNRERRVPVILVSAHHDEGLLARANSDHIMTYLVKPVKPPDVQAAITIAVNRFEQFQKVVQEAESLRQALEDRKVVERAKEAVTRRVGVPEAEAFRRMRKFASDRNLKLVQVAQQILSAEEVFHALDGV